MRNTLLKHFITLLLGIYFLTSNSQAQFKERYFTDTTYLGQSTGVGSIDYKNQFIVYGLTNNRTSIFCIDSNGNRVWQFIHPTSSDPIAHLFLGRDSFLYASTFQYAAKKITYWKFNPENGAQVWTKTLSANGYTEMIDYDSSRFLVSYNDFTQSAFRFAFMSKTSGNMINNYLISNATPNVYIAKLAVDSALHIYCGIGDSVIKFNSAQPTQSFWRKKCINPGIKDISLLHYNKQTDAVYALATSTDSREEGVVFKLETNSGNILSGYKCTNYGSCKPILSIIKNHFLYISWQHLYVGGGTYSNLITKYNLLSDTATWSIRKDITTSGGECTQALAIDEAGFVYATGYTAADNYGPGMLSVLKIEPVNGNMLIGKTIRETPPATDDNYSNGFAISHRNGHIYLIANLEPYTKNVGQLTLFKLSSDSMHTLSKTKFANYARPASAIQIKSLPNGNTAVFKQFGDAAGIEMYNRNHQLIWEKAYKSQIFEGAFLNITPNGTMIISGLTYKDSTAFPYKSSIVDSVVFFRIDATNGNIINKTSQLVRASGIKPVEMHTDDSSTLFLFEYQNRVWWVQLKNNTISTIRGPGIYNTNISENTSRVGFNKNAFNYYMFGLNTSSPNADKSRVFKINKTTLSIKDTLELPVFNSINYTHAIDTSLVVLCGRGSSAKEAVGVYNASTFNMVWSYLHPQTGSMISQCITDPSATYLYTVSYSTTNIILRKFLLRNGALIKTYEFTADSSNKAEVPLAITYNKPTNRVIITGFQRDGSVQNTFVLAVDHSLTHHWFTVKNNPDQLSRGTTIDAVNQQATWIGGHTTSNSGIQTGFIYTLSDTNLCIPTQSTDSVQSCGAYLWQNKWLLQSGTYYDTLLNSRGCDSIMSLHINIVSVDTSVTVSSGGLTSNAVGATYQWIDCNGGNAITGATNAQFTPAGTGVYAVIVSKDGCSKTSGCIPFTYTSTNEINNKTSLLIYPNPLVNMATLELNGIDVGKNNRFELYNLFGQYLYEQSFNGTNKLVINRNALAPGIYFYTIRQDNRIIHTGKLVVSD